jgi:peptide chain release factor 1
MRVLRARLYEAERDRQRSEQAAARNAQVGRGERAEKIRTYNFPQDRVTDHRVGVSGRLQDVMQGDLDEFTDALREDEQRRGLEGEG